ncbi:flavodoxin family protein [Cetobacterium sp.]|uniref:flavodoxin family protein n=1 Tax=Cetobacterium sp. TaxID=2071632 RepID=UPI003F35590D
MKVVIINGSPRRNGNTAILCEEFMKGVKSEEDADVEIVNLYDLKYTGCKSCFACKKKDEKTYGRCVIKDDIHDLLERAASADGIVFASPIFFSEITAQLRAFLERLLYSRHTYEADFKSVAKKRMPIHIIYTMNATKEQVEQHKYKELLGVVEEIIGDVFTKPTISYAFNTYQFNNYDNYRAEAFSEPNKAEYKRVQFPIDRNSVFESGKEMVLKIKN